MKTLSLLTFLALLAAAQSASACSACFGKSDSAMAQGMNAGIFSLLAIIVPVLGGVAGFFVYLAKRANLAHAVTSSAHAAAVEKVTSEVSLATTGK